VEKGENEGKTLLDAMRDGETEGMQDFDGSIEKLVRAGVVELETGLAYATNPGNLRLSLADLSEEGLRAAAPNPPQKPIEKPSPKPADSRAREPELVIE
jgi:twitching motility protein PilT